MVGPDTSFPRPIGILYFATAGERIAGDPGFVGTFPFPVLYGTVEGSYRDLITGSDDACRRLCLAARELADQGACAIAGDCGLMAMYQREMADCAGVPVVSSSLVLLPFLRQIVPQDTHIGILTGHSELLAYSHLVGAGAGELQNIAIQGMQDEPHFRETVIEGRGHHDYQLMKADVIHATEKLLARSSRTGAILLECSNLTTYGYEISNRFALPVFDINTAIGFLQRSFNQTNYSNH